VPLATPELSVGEEEEAFQEIAADKVPRNVGIVPLEASCCPPTSLFSSVPCKAAQSDSCWGRISVSTSSEWNG